MSSTNSYYNQWAKPYLKKAAQEEAANYNDLAFFQKSKNALFTFFVIINLISIIVIPLLGLIEVEYFAIEMTINLILLPFIYFNHRWAIALQCFLYLLDKVSLAYSDIGNPFSQIIFGYICFSLSVGAYRVATEIKKLEVDQSCSGLKNNNTTPDKIKN